MAESPDCILRERLKVALRDAKRLFDESLIDENELKDLKEHELRKYKAQLSALAAPTPSSTPQSVRHASRATSEELQTPPHAEKRRIPVADDTLRIPRMPVSAPVHRKRGFEVLNHALMARMEDDERTLYVEPEIYERLTTPPIFRRRPRAKRRIVLKSADLAALQRDNTVA